MPDFIVEMERSAAEYRLLQVTAETVEEAEARVLQGEGQEVEHFIVGDQESVWGVLDVYKKE